MNEALIREYGNDILDRIDDFFSLKTDAERELFKSTNQDLMDALSLQTQLIASDPVWLPYYGGIDKLERYYTNEMYDQLEQKYGPEVLAIARMYSATINREEKKSILKQNPILKKYWDDREIISNENMRKIAEFGAQLPETQLDIYGEPQNPDQAQIAQLAAPQPQISFEQRQEILGPSMIALIEDFAEGAEIPYSVQKNLDYYAERLGYGYGDELLQDVLISMNR